MSPRNARSGHRLGVPKVRVTRNRPGKAGVAGRFLEPAEPGAVFEPVRKRIVFGETLLPGRKRGYSSSLAKGVTLSAHLMAILKRESPAIAELAELERRFHPVRKWRFDVAWTRERVAVECDGGIYSGGAHVRGVGVEDDAEKQSEAAALGWRVLRLTRKMIDDGRAVSVIARALAWEGDR